MRSETENGVGFRSLGTGPAVSGSRKWILLGVGILPPSPGVSLLSSFIETDSADDVCWMFRYSERDCFGRVPISGVSTGSDGLVPTSETSAISASRLDPSRGLGFRHILLAGIEESESGDSESGLRPVGVCNCEVRWLSMHCTLTEFPATTAGIRTRGLGTGYGNGKQVHVCTCSLTHVAILTTQFHQNFRVLRGYNNKLKRFTIK